MRWRGRGPVLRRLRFRLLCASGSIFEESGQRLQPRATPPPFIFLRNNPCSLPGAPPKPSNYLLQCQSWEKWLLQRPSEGTPFMSGSVTALSTSVPCPLRAINKKTRQPSPCETLSLVFCVMSLSISAVSLACFLWKSSRGREPHPHIPFPTGH